MTLDEIRSTVGTLLDEGEPPDSDLSRAGVLLWASFVVGADNARLNQFTGIAMDFVRKAGYRGRRAGIWQRGPERNKWRTIVVDWMHEDAGQLAFHLDCMVLTGELVRESRRNGAGEPDHAYGFNREPGYIEESEADAYEMLEQMRWEGWPNCPHCGEELPYFLRPANGVSRATRTGAQSQRRVWKCCKCRKQFSVLTGTVFQGTKVPIRTVLAACRAGSRSVRAVERRFDVTARTAAAIINRCEADDELLGWHSWQNPAV